MKTFVIVTTLALVSIAGCRTWHGLGHDIGRMGDSMAGEGKYVTTVQATPDKVTDAARRAVGQLGMTDIDTSGTTSEGRVTAKTAQNEKVRIDIAQSGDDGASTVTIHTRGGDADAVSKRIQDQISSNLR